MYDLVIIGAGVNGCSGKRIDDRLTPARFFHRLVKRLK